jgi:hypothetical protein
MDGEWILSEEMKRFGEIAQTKRINFIKAKLTKETSLGFWQPIPIIREEADHQKTESSLTKPQILTIINSLNPFLSDTERLRFRGLSNKSRDTFFKILEIYYSKIVLVLTNKKQSYS